MESVEVTRRTVRAKECGCERCELVLHARQARGRDVMRHYRQCVKEKRLRTRGLL